MGEVYSTKRQSSPVGLHPVPTEQVLAGCKNEMARKVEPNNTEAARGLAVPATVSAMEVEVGSVHRLSGLLMGIGLTDIRDSGVNVAAEQLGKKSRELCMNAATQKMCSPNSG